MHAVHGPDYIIYHLFFISVLRSQRAMTWTWFRAWEESFVCWHNLTLSKHYTKLPETTFRESRVKMRSLMTWTGCTLAWAGYETNNVFFPESHHCHMRSPEMCELCASFSKQLNVWHHRTNFSPCFLFSVWQPIVELHFHKNLKSNDYLVTLN